MFVPEYSITLKTLKGIATIEYAKAIVENTTLLSNFQSRLHKEAEVEFIYDILFSLGINSNKEQLKESLEYGEQRSVELNKILKTLKLADDSVVSTELDESIITVLRTSIGLGTKYRDLKKDYHTQPEEILAAISELFDWYNSLDAKETHPILVAGIVSAQLEYISPYSTHNLSVVILVAYILLKATGYTFYNYMAVSKLFTTNRKEYEHALQSIWQNEYDLTVWLEFFTGMAASNASNVEQKVRLLARDSKVAKSTGRTDLTDRQEKIIEYLQDYGMIQNKHFKKLFPDVSEDSVLRDLKKLVDAEIIAKRGSTKSSRYELK